MPNLGPTEIIILLILIAIIVGVIALARSAGARPDATLAWRTPGFLPPVPEHVQERIRELFAEGRKVEAIKVLRQETGLGLKEAKTTAEAIAAGRFIPTPPDRPGTNDLAARVLELKAAGRTEQAIYLVRGETGMTHEQAEAFVNAI
ncbi:hypothetical protein Aph01nite_50540 [Acrocarpospora phusangensis]|uniref:Ribosomal protein L7/L12 C-terminal domain-containing protein n=1 Tax=Acrocarpospora phusangensis TaxID=1070424 RepID=A0A919QCM1_9ACTN|nr:ribosomal protein L7/L12 [Acrocarpospora phusangensis]GIH26744.1 hypothetical protein Aph01nite_50540 [Acrocarpospora phusangensis]